MALVRILADAGQHLEAYPRLEEFTAFAVQYRYEAYDRSEETLDRHRTLAMVRALVMDVAAAINPS